MDPHMPAARRRFRLDLPSRCGGIGGMLSSPRRTLLRSLAPGFFLVAAMSAAPITPVPASGQDWPQWRGARRDGVWRETGLVEKFSGTVVPLKWSVPVGAGYSGPTVAAGRVYLMDFVKETSSERVQCFDWGTAPGRR
jgi:hypothetical protein